MSQLIQQLRDLLPGESLITGDESLRVYECDGLSAYREIPACVVLPETVAEIQAIMRICHANDTPVVARGAGTGLSGGALPIAEGVLLSLSKLNQILEVDPILKVARVQTGVRNLSVSEAARPYGLFYAPDPSSQVACTIGGNIAENSGGVHCLKYGLTVHNVMGVKVVTVEGDLIELGGTAFDDAGYDLTALLIPISKSCWRPLIQSKKRVMELPISYPRALSLPVWR